MKNLRILTSLMLLGLLCACGGGERGQKAPYAGVKVGQPYEINGRWYKPGYDKHYDEMGVASWYGPGFHGGHTASGERYDQEDMTAAHRTLPLPSIVRVTNLDNGLSAIVKVNDRGPFAHSRIIDLSRGAARKLGVIRTGTAHVRVQFLDRETQEYVRNMQESGTRYAMREMNRSNGLAQEERQEARVPPPVLRTQMVSAAEASPPPAPPPVEVVRAEPPAPSGSVFSVVDSSDIEPHQLIPAVYQTAVPPARFALAASPDAAFFVQVATFSYEQNALSLIRRISEIEQPQVMKVVINGRKFYRVMAGPYGTQENAKNMLSKLASIGISDAKIIRN